MSSTSSRAPRARAESRLRAPSRPVPGIVIGRDDARRAAALALEREEPVPCADVEDRQSLERGGQVRAGRAATAYRRPRCVMMPPPSRSCDTSEASPPTRASYWSCARHRGPHSVMWPSRHAGHRSCTKMKGSHGRVERHAQPAPHRLPDEGQPSDGRAAGARPLGGDGAVRADPRAAARAARSSSCTTGRRTPTAGSTSAPR